MNRTLFLSVLAAALLSFGCAGADRAQEPAKKHRKIALHGYVYRDISLAETVKKAAEMKVDGVVLTKRQFIGGKYPNARVDEKMTPEQREYVKKMFADNGLEIAAFGVYSVPADRIDAHLDFCKDMGIAVFTEEHKRADQKLWNDSAEKRGVKVALHHHGRKTNEYWDPKVIAETVSKYGNIGVCADNGHWARAGVDACYGYKTIGKKLVMLHFKDVILPRGEDTWLDGGSLDVPKMLETLDRIGFDGYFVLEYEGGDKNLDPIMRKSIEFLRAH